MNNKTNEKNEKTKKEENVLYEQFLIHRGYTSKMEKLSIFVAFILLKITKYT